MSDDDAVTLSELEEGMRSLGVSRAVRRAALVDARSIARSFVADGFPADRVRYRAEVCDCCGCLNVTTLCFGVRRGAMH
jgi:hypothetical protein